MDLRTEDIKGLMFRTWGLELTVFGFRGLGVGFRALGFWGSGFWGLCFRF